MTYVMTYRVAFFSSTAAVNCYLASECFW